MKKQWLIPLLGLLALCGCKSKSVPMNQDSAKQVDSESGNKIEYYTCAMHRFIHLDKPGNCPICGMKLVPVYAEGTKHSDHAPMAIATPEPEKRGDVSLGETKRQLLGVRSETAELRAISHEIDAAGRVAYDPDLMVAQSDYLVALHTGGGELGGLQGGLAKAAKLRLQAMGMGEAQISELRRRGRPDVNLLVPQPGQSSLVYASVFETDLPWIYPGMPLTVEIPGTGRVLTTELTSIDPAVNPATRTATVRFALSNPDGHLRPEMYLKVRLRSEGERKLSVPKEALIDTGTKQIVYLDLGDGRYQPREVKIGRRGDEYVEILAGLQSGDRVVAQGNFLIDSESRLRGGSGGGQQP